MYIDNQNAVAVAKCKNPACTQKTSTVASFIDADHLVDVAIGPDGNPRIAYTSGSVLYVLRCKNATCTQKAPIAPVYEANGEGLDYATIAIQPNGFPIVAAHTTQTHDVVVYTCGDVDCANGTFTAIQGAGDDIGKYLSIGILGTGAPVIAYYNETDSNPEVVVCIGGCVKRITTVLDIGDMGTHLAMTIGQDGYPMIIFENAAAGLHLWNCNSFDCNAAIQQSLGGSAGAEHNAISIDGNGVPVMLSDDNDLSEIKFIRCGDSECSTTIQPTRVPLDDTGNAANSISVGPNGLPYLAFRSDTTNGPRLVRCGNPFCLEHWSRP